MFCFYDVNYFMTNMEKGPTYEPPFKLINNNQGTSQDNVLLGIHSHSSMSRYQSYPYSMQSHFNKAAAVMMKPSLWHKVKEIFCFSRYLVDLRTLNSDRRREPPRCERNLSAGMANKELAKQHSPFHLTHLTYIIHALQHFEDTRVLVQIHTWAKP